MLSQQSFEVDSLLKKGSVKDIYRVKNNSEQLYFSYSDRYSVFDWGEMPDQLEGKGESLSYMAWTFFRLLEDPQVWQKANINVVGEVEKELLSNFCKQGMPHHAISRPTSNGLLVEKIDVHEPPFNSKKGQWDYTFYREEKPSHALVPLELVFRFGVPSGSSLINRMTPEYLNNLGLKQAPGQGEWLEREVIEMSTKLESTDKYLLADQAQSIAGLSNGEFDHLKGFTSLASHFLKDVYESRGMELWDGKVEVGFNGNKDELSGGRNFMLVDSVGPDELRLMLPGQKIPLSKEVLRQYYRNGEWAKSVEQAKKLAKERQVSDWKIICVEELGATPDALPVSIKASASMLYLSLANELAMYAKDQRPFPNASPLNKAVTELKESFEI